MCRPRSVLVKTGIGGKRGLSVSPRRHQAIAVIAFPGPFEECRRGLEGYVERYTKELGSALLAAARDSSIPLRRFSWLSGTRLSHMEQRS
jgi:hypothetical protein